MRFKIISAISMVLMISINIFFLITSPSEMMWEILFEVLMPMDGVFVAIFGSVVAAVKKKGGKKRSKVWDETKDSEDDDNWDFD